MAVLGQILPLACHELPTLEDQVGAEVVQILDDHQIGPVAGRRGARSVSP